MAISDDDRALLERMATDIATAQAALDAAAAQRDDAIRLALEAGASPTWLARLFRLSRVRIYQIRDRA